MSTLPYDLTLDFVPDSSDDRIRARCVRNSAGEPAPLDGVEVPRPGVDKGVRNKIAPSIVYLADSPPEIHDVSCYTKTCQPRPYADVLTGAIRELRVSFGRLEIRMLYFIHGRRIVLTNGFLKKTSRVPESEIARAERLRVQWLASQGRA